MTDSGLVPTLLLVAAVVAMAWRQWRGGTPPDGGPPWGKPW